MVSAIPSYHSPRDHPTWQPSKELRSDSLKAQSPKYQSVADTFVQLFSLTASGLIEGHRRNKMSNAQTETAIWLAARFAVRSPSRWSTFTDTEISASSNLGISTLSSKYRSVRSMTRSLAANLSAEDQMVQSCADASPVKWHQAHTTWFFETFVLRPFLSDYKPFREEFHWLFNSYYISLGEEIPEKRLRSSFSRPSLGEVVAFRAHVDQEMERLFENSIDAEVYRRIVLGLSHEQQHQELALTDIKHAFFSNPLRPAYRSTAPRDDRKHPAPELSW